MSLNQPSPPQSKSNPAPKAANTLSSSALEAALRSARQTFAAQGSQSGLWGLLLQTSGATPEALASALLENFDVRVVDDTEFAALKRRVLHASAIGQGQTLAVVPVQLAGSSGWLCADPWSDAALKALQRDPQSGSCLILARDKQLETLLPRDGQMDETFAPPSQAHKAVVTSDAATPSALDPDSSVVVQFVDQAIQRAYLEGASDIHFESNRDGVSLKFRLDGVMAAGDSLATVQRAEEVISRIKVLAQLDITERRRPQDGRIHWTPARLGKSAEASVQAAIDLRVSIMPSIHGEDAVLRLLDKAQLRQTQQAMSLDVLGFEGSVAATLRDLSSRPHGMLLITGPTGSGKTTTVYAALSEVNDGLEKIITIEDPVEYELPGVLQIPVNEQKGLTFATGLRSILRHDPDKILVGEIRDAETAEIAVQSSLTGHLVFTTVHANSLFDVLGRFQHFGIEPFALASALNGIVVQRLLRQLCPHCTQWRQPTETEKSHLQRHGRADLVQVPQVCGCGQCRGTGYRGRFVVAEVHALDDAMRDLIVNRPSMASLKTHIYQDASNQLLQRALAKVQVGQTSLEEVHRVVGLA